MSVDRESGPTWPDPLPVGSPPAALKVSAGLHSFPEPGVLFRAHRLLAELVSVHDKAPLSCEPSAWGL